MVYPIDPTVHNIVLEEHRARKLESWRRPPSRTGRIAVGSYDYAGPSIPPRSQLFVFKRYPRMVHNR